MKRSGFLALGGMFVALATAMAACGGDEEPGPGSSGGGTDAGSSGTSDANASSSGVITQCEEPAVDTVCNAAACSGAMGEPSVCRNGQCVKLASQDCKAGDIFGAVGDDRALWIGGAMAMVLGNGKINTSGPPRRNSIELAVNEINDNGGVPAGPGCAPRPLAAIVCDDGSQTSTSGTSDATERVGAHLINELGIRGIIGGGVSGSTINMAQKVAFPAGALMIAPSATAIAITDLAGANPAEGVRLLWRTAPSDLLQSQALVALYTQLVGNTPTRLAIVNKTDAYGVGLADAFQAQASLNGSPIVVQPAGDDAGAGVGVKAPGFFRASCDPQSEGDAAPCAGVIEELQALKPTVILLSGTAESVTRTMNFYEQTAEAAETPPFYLVPDGPAKPDLWAAVQAKPSLATRIRGTVPGVVTPLADSFFNFRYKAKYPKAPDTDGNPTDSTLVFGMAGSYDATYLLTYAMLASGTSKTTFTGAELAAGLGKTISGQQVDVGTALFGTAAQALQSGQQVNFNGASGPLDFNVQRGEAPSDMIVWCVRRNPTSGNYERYDSTNQTFSAAGQLVGDFSCPE